ncbi:aminoglycoside phosphotransferase family protein [Phragmitibacter flavus]|uniref:Aminoglycoside phosphotransferase family protein n=1 Tax=Phragmitibacter flavus TaxID=2576071 RepID=A0A5R8K7P6_9BACT|nr:aminoglycoside phosphotransferase family protein [Phragmitibacter flavus]TLD68362.1 aminoglycoside phosphotransferase family protein [Phragmitibacter flavus]
MLESPPAASQKTSPSPRRSIYYWKCDRPAAFHGTTGQHHHALLAPQVQTLIENHFNAPAEVHPGPGQGNHITFTATCKNLPLFIRIDDSPEHDDYLAIESRLQQTVLALGIPTPVIHACDATRSQVPFAWQIMQRIDAPDINHHFKNQQLNLPDISSSIGHAIAQWQTLQPTGFGPFQTSLTSIHPTYPDYFFLHFERHLHYLTSTGFLTETEAAAIEHEVLQHQSLLNLPQGCLVHKDLAFWNILGTPEKITAFIDWDDAICGDPMDDFSLLACFHNSEVLLPALEAYQQTRPLPENHQRRFWLHLLRNMLVKSVIRIGAGYFDRKDLYLNPHQTDLKTFTHQRLQTALTGLRQASCISQISNLKS